MSYILNYEYINIDMEIEENIKITVFPYEFILECDNEMVRQSMISFLEYLDVDLNELNSEKLENIIKNEFKI